MYVETKTLPSHVRNCLSNLGFHQRDIAVNTANTVCPHISGSQGNRGYIAVLNLETGKYKTMLGSWGGANMFNPQNRVDLDQNNYPIPENHIIIKGQQGNYNYAKIYARTETMAQVLPHTENLELTRAEHDGLYCVATIRGGNYRKEEMRRRNVSQDTMASLANKGLITINKRGATQITTKGRNVWSSISSQV